MSEEGWVRITTRITSNWMPGEMRFLPMDHPPAMPHQAVQEDSAEQAWPTFYGPGPFPDLAALGYRAPRRKQDWSPRDLNP